MPAGWVSAAVGVAGALSSDSGGGGGSTASKEPWAEAAPWLKDLLAQGQDLQGYYQQNPFSPQQQQSYQNTFSDLDTLRNGYAPAIQGLANQFMGSAYQRQPQQRRELQTANGMQGLLQQPMQAQSQAPAMPQQGLLAGPSQSPMPTATPVSGGQLGGLGGGSYGQVDWAKLNPYGPGQSLDPNKVPAVEAPAAPAVDRWRDPNTNPTTWAPGIDWAWDSHTGTWVSPQSGGGA